MVRCDNGSRLAWKASGCNSPVGSSPTLTANLKDLDVDALEEEIERVQREMADLYPHIQWSDSANVTFEELRQELRELRRKQKDERKGF